MIPIVNKGKILRRGFRADKAVILEIKAVCAFRPEHDAKILTCLRMSEIRIGLILNVHALRLKDDLSTLRG